MSTTRILAATPEAIAEAAALLRAGELVAVPTETVYGLAAIATRDDALARIFEAKERPTFDPLIVHVASLEEFLEGPLVDWSCLDAVASETAERLARAFWPGPLTLVLPKQATVPDLATSGLPTVAVRLPRHEVARALINAVGAPLAAPSANRFGRISPTTARAVVEELGGRIPLVLDGGRCAVGVESTVIQVRPDGALSLLRPGGTPVEEIERVAGRRSRFEGPVASGAMPGPGMLESHYAPARPLLLLPRRLNLMSPDELASWLPAGARAVAVLRLFASPPTEPRWPAGVRCLATQTLASHEGDWNEAACHLFASLRALDASGADCLLAEPCEARVGLAYAIGDRLRRAAAAQRA